MIASQDDIDRIMAVMSTAFAPEFGEAWTRRQVEDALFVGNCHHVLIAASGEIPRIGEPAAGFFLSRYGYEEEELLLLAVDPAHRRMGIGNRLLEIFATEAAARGAHRLVLEMRRGNPAEALYRTHGFLPVGTRINYYRTPSGTRLDAITFCRNL